MQTGLRTAYHESLETTRLDVVRLGALVSDAFHSAVAALEKRDQALAGRVVAGDEGVDELQSKTEQACIELIWKQQPVAGELRLIAAMLETAIDLKAIAEHSTEIAKDAIRLADIPLRPARVEIGRIAAIANEMLRDAMQSFTERDFDLSKRVVDRDDEVDKLYRRGIEALQQEMQADPAMVQAGTLMLFVLSNIERTGDRAQNIAWHTQEMLGER